MSAVLTTSGADGAIDRSQFQSVPLSGLRIGATLNAPIFDDRSDRNVLLLSAGTTITQNLLDLINQRGISKVRVHASEVARLTGSAQTQRASNKQYDLQQAVKRAAGQTVRKANGRWAVTAKSFVNEVQQHGPAKFTPQQAKECQKQIENSVTQVDDLFKSLSDGTDADPAIMTQVANDALFQIADDSDLFASLGIQPGADKYPSRHSTQTAMLAMSIGTTLGLSQKELVELGIGCLIHDVGMLQINRRIFQSGRVLDKIEFLEITKHPALTFDMISKYNDFPTGSRMVAYQMHERFNGTGYPRNRSGCQIHFLTRIATVADVFIALISPRPHREGLLPYQAMEQLIKGAKLRLYDPTVVRGLLQTLSLFPVGSFVEMNDGRIGKVIRANGDHYTQPVVEIWTPDNPHLQPTVVDLKDEIQLAVSGPCREMECQDGSADRLTDHWE